MQMNSLEKQMKEGNALQHSTFNTSVIRAAFILIALSMKSCISVMITVPGAALITVPSDPSAERCEFGLEVLSLDIPFRFNTKVSF